jgi:hypothetical protein
MPRAVADAGVSEAEVSLTGMAEAILRQLTAAAAQ